MFCGVAALCNLCIDGKKEENQGEIRSTISFGAAPGEKPFCRIEQGTPARYRCLCLESFLDAFVDWSLH